MPTERAPRRFKGSEVEYPYRVKKGLDPTSPPNLTTKKIKTLSGGFMENGARHYIDANQRPEYANGEIESLDELIAHELAGEEIVAVGQILDPQSPIAAFFKRCISPELKFTDGTHENYETELNVWKENEAMYFKYALGTHFATRSAYIGAGVVATNGEYWLAQKMQGISTFEGKDSLSNKALVNLRDEPHAGGDASTKRLHVVCGDANISPFALYMKFGTTSLVLRLLENGVDISDLLLKDPLSSAQRVSKKINEMNTPLPLQNGKQMSALDIQEALAHRAFALSCKIELPEDEQMILYEWLSVIHALRAYQNTGVISHDLRQLDWYVKWEMIQKAHEHEKSIPAQRVDFAYHKLLNGAGVKLRESNDYFAPYMPSFEQIQQAKVIPPPGRASLRGGFIKHALERRGSKSDTVNTDAGWDYVSYIKNGESKRVSLPLHDDYSKPAVMTKLKEIF